MKTLLSARMLVATVITLVTSSSVMGCNGKIAPPSGELIGVCTSYGRVSESNLGFTKYTIEVISDSSYAGTVPFSFRSSVELWTPGIDGPASLTFPEPVGSVSSVSVAIPECVRILYSELDGKLFILDKWTAWLDGDEYDWKRNLDAGVVYSSAVEQRLFEIVGKPAFDNIVLYHSKWAPDVFAEPLTDDWVRLYGGALMGHGSRAGTLREVRNREKEGR